MVIVTMLTVGVFLGCRFFSYSMETDGKSFYKKNNFYDLEVIGKTGFMDSDLEQFRNLEGVEDVEGYHQIDVTAELMNKNVLIPMLLKTERISTPELIEGAFPEKKGELAVSRGLKERYNVQIGETIHITTEGDQDKLLTAHDYVITGVVNHPAYLQVSKDDFLLASEDSFNSEELNGGYLRALIRVKYPEDLDIFSEKYFDVTLPVEERIEKLFPQMIEDHKETLSELAERKIQEETSGPRQRLEDSEVKLRQGREELEEAEEKLEATRQQLAKAEQDLRDAQKKLDDSKKKLEEGQKELEDGEKLLAEKQAQFDLNSEEAGKKISDAKSKLGSAEQEAKDGLIRLDAMEAILIGIEKDLGESDLPAGYYSLKARAEEFYREAMKAAVEEKDNKALLKKAEEDTDAAANEGMKQLGIEDALNGASFRRFTEFAREYYGDVKLLDVLKGSKSFLSIDQDELKKLIAHLEEKNPGLKLSETIRYLESSDEVKGLLDTKITVLPDKIREMVRTYFNGYGKALAAKKAINEAKEKLAAAEKQMNDELSKAEKQLKDGREKLEESRKQLEEGKAEYEKGLADLKTGQEKYEKGVEEFQNGFAEYTENEHKLEDGEADCRLGLKLMESKIDHERSKLSDRLDSYFVVQNRRANEGFVTLKSVLSMIGNGALAFIVLFLVVLAMVTFSTIAIIVDEQRNLAGTMKSLGFFNDAIRKKYLIFGLSAAGTGILLGIGAAIGVESVFRYGMVAMFVFGRVSFSFRIISLILVSVLLLSVVFIAIYASTNGMLKLSAIQLMSGFKAGRTLQGKNEQKKKGGLYNRLIFRNMRTEIERVSITTLIIAISCGMIGIGFNLKNAFSGMMDRQIQEVWGFDLKISYDEEVNDSKRKEMEKVITDSGATCASVAEIPTIYRDRDLQEYTYIMVMDQEVVGDYYHVKDWDTGEEMTLPEDGVLIQNRMYETRGLKSGDRYTLFDHKLKEHDVGVKGVYTNFVGRTVIMSRDGYYSLFGLKASNNTFLVRLNGVDRSSLLSDIKNVLPEVTYQTPEMLRDQFSDMQGSFDSVVYMLTGLAIFMSIFVLANLTNIFVSRRRKEMIIMRVNGFSTRQCIGYLIRETVITAAAGFVIAVILCGLISRMMVGVLETSITMLDRRFQPVSWLIAIALETVFAFCIDFFVFRKARKLKVTDINL